MKADRVAGRVRHHQFRLQGLHCLHELSKGGMEGVENMPHLRGRPCHHLLNVAGAPECITSQDAQKDDRNLVRFKGRGLGWRYRGSEEGGFSRETHPLLELRGQWCAVRVELRSWP